MEQQYQNLKGRISQDFMQAVLRLVLLLLGLWVCAKIFSPFASIMLWALILAVTLYPLHLWLRASLSGSDSRAGTVIAVIGLLVLGVPTVLLGLSLVDHLADLLQQYKAGTLTVSPPAESVREWPLVGPKLYEGWLAASENLEAVLVEHGEQVRGLIRRGIGGTTDILGTVGLFLGAIVIAAIMMAYGEQGSAAMGRIASTLAGSERGLKLQQLSVATMRSVATGVIGVAVIQALLLGVGFLWAGVPAAGALAVVALIIGIIQLPALLLTLPVLGWLWSSGDGGTLMNSLITVYLVIAGLSDGVLKPMLLGRGVDVPMPVVLIGALGGMVSMGMMGLFLGSVILSVAYQLLWAWVDHETEVAGADQVVESPSADS
ncbi:MAG: AI-2E family transporter [Cellvibrionales bacterium]|jgi:predicted PurR-regulated permease PerM